MCYTSIKKEYIIFNQANNFTLLYVEDDKLTQKIVQSVLKGYFKKIFVADNGEEGLELYKEASPDIVLADISMPKMDGLEMCRKIRDVCQQQQIVLFTGYNEIDYLSKAINMNINKYIMKPLKTKQMFEVLDEIVKELKKEKESEAYKKDLEFASHHDLLTGLANRKLFFKHLEQLVSDSLREKKAIAILSMDLNRFKPINDTYGHDVGDIVLKKVAHYLEKSLRKSDIISRFGGDEFVIAVGFLKDHNHILKFLERLERNFLEPVIHRDDDGITHKLNIGFSMGITFYNAYINSSFHTLLREADKAMYRAKELKVPYMFFDPNEESKFKIKARKAKEIKDAIKRGEFLLYYQPIVEIKNQQAVAFESLLRWNHPKKGLLTPDEFLPYIWDNLETRSYLSEWIMESVFSQYERWVEEGKAFKLSINMSSLEFHSEQFLSITKKLLKKYSKVLTSDIIFEIDEATAIKDSIVKNSIIKELTQMGFKIALDDFGTGNSTLNHLQTFNIDTLKIDKSFVIEMLNDKESHTIVDASIKLAKVFDYKVVAIGLEHKEQLPDLEKLGCDQAQGYGIARPMPSSEVLNFIQEAT